MDLVLLGWRAFQLTDSPFMVAVAAFARSAPMLLLGPFTGLVADRMHRRRVLVFTKALELVTARALAGVFAAGREGFWPMVGLEVLFGALWALDFPRRTALYALAGPRRVVTAVSLETVAELWFEDRAAMDRALASRCTHAALPRALSLFHVPLPVGLVWLVTRLGYDRRAWLAQSLLALIVLPVSYWLTDPGENVNWVHGLGRPQSVLPPWAYLALLIVAFALVLYLPPHLAFTYFPLSVRSS